MIQFQVSAYIKRPADQVFAFLTDAKNLRNWQSNLVENEILTEGPLRAGTRFREVRRMGPRQSEIQGEITVFDPNKQFSTKTVTEPHVTVSYSLQEENGGTRIDYKFVMLTRGFMRLIEPFIGGSIKKETNLDFQTIKRILET